MSQVRERETPVVVRPPRRRRRVVAGAVVVALAVPGVSLGRAMVAPGAAPASVRAVEWVRDHGGNHLVDLAENWWFSRHVAAGAVPSTHPVTTAQAAAAPHPVASVTGHAPGQGDWTPGRVGRDGLPALYTTWFRPDAQHPGVVAAAAWIRAGGYDAHLVAGTTQPGGGPWPGGARVAPQDVPDLLATFNAGFKFHDTPGGFFAGGRSSRPLVDGLATAVVDDSGRLQVGTLGREVSIGPHTVAARQNLQLIVDGGAPVPGLDQNGSGRWGTSHNQGQYTWRSALGTDAAGDVVYVGGNGLDLVDLADALVRAGAVRGMELDMHSGMVSFSSWTVAGGTVTPTKLLPDMTREANRYLAPDQRDFFYLTLA
ncbi:phosphodiester glycosidase family protein [Kineococcus rhizosphaerae]|uniref:Phosphodiester glycosidase domain-containing protein n=1 Tax=Kineococcus rhizosphaerae TaxID=559628 RepID=A0A2T0QXM5_9ACTN|nr:phosphodiester glycosidase family protein [Kineococcus rhizosphaerae]PRY10773.1 hypothetical protein CLV37_11537 [Kineococcus rhizosphaerae]